MEAETNTGVAKYGSRPSFGSKTNDRAETIYLYRSEKEQSLRQCAKLVLPGKSKGEPGKSPAETSTGNYSGSEMVYEDSLQKSSMKTGVKMNVRWEF